MEIINQYERKNHHVGGSFWHLEWCTKYRYKMMRKEYYNTLCAILIFDVAKRNKIEILSFSVQIDHVHLVVKLQKGMTDSKALQFLKGTTSRLLFLEAPELAKRYPKHKFWSAGNFSTTVGFANLQETISYVKNQDEHHKLYLQ